ncbi:integrase core domain-containing protein [Streptomyces sp. NPDC056161]|uniref:integrase core domain-containing protein n=1 Tax=Streptomyces sp. NPDC056161 TaxID=3345732 RepID=UPI0035D72CB0
MTQSTGRVGSCFDIALSEAFNSVLRVEYVHRHTFATRTEARLKVATWITGLYNTRRLHSVYGCRSPIDHEHDHPANSALEPAT